MRRKKKGRSTKSEVKSTSKGSIQTEQTHQLDEGRVERVQVHRKRQLHLDVAVGVVLPQLLQVNAERARAAHAVDFHLYMPSPIECDSVPLTKPRRNTMVE